jgi:hypothetical protein
MPTASKLEAALRKIVEHLLVTSPTLILGFLHGRLVSFLPDMLPKEMRSWLVWLAISTVLATSLFLFYLYRYLVTKKALLTVNPDYFSEQLNARLWEQVTRDRASEKNKT